MKIQHVKLTAKDREYLESLISKGKLPAKMFKRATGLLELDRGKTLTAVAETLGVRYVTVAAWRDGYKE
jgi:putative transposase